MKKAALILAGLLGLVVIVGAGLYATNSTPAVPALSAAEASRPTRPIVVKLHAQWCPVCMTTKGVWGEIAAAYGDKVNLVVFDFTTGATTEASRAEAKRLGLEKFFDEYQGVSGPIVILDERTRTVRNEITGSRRFSDYRSAIDAALKHEPVPKG